jgi:hypothetical protein
LAMVFSLLAAPVMAQGSEGTLITQRVTSGGDVLTIRMQIQTTRMRTDVVSASGPSQVTVFDADKQLLYSIDPVGKTFIEITKADFDRMRGFVLGTIAQMERQLETIPPAQRAQMEAMIKGRGGATTFPDSLFAVPADFKRQDFMGMGGRGIDQRR